MALRWAWDWGIGLPRIFYANDPNWGVIGSDSVVDTVSTTNLVSPAGPGTPGEQFNCRITGGDAAASITTPDFPGAAVTQGFFVTRFRTNKTGSISNGTGNNIVSLREGSTNRVQLRGDIFGSTVPLELFVNGTSVGTTSRLVGDAESYVFSLDFNMALVPPQAGLIMDGVREISIGAGSGTATEITNARISSGTANQPCEHGLLLLFDSLADSRGNNAYYWGVGLNANVLTDTGGSWSIFGGAASKIAAISDRDEATGIDTTTDPDVVTVDFEATTDILAGWNPGTILMVVAVAVGSADVVDQATVTLSDGVGTAGSTLETLTAVQSMVIVYAELNSVAGAWTFGEVNAANYTYNVST